ncbi:MAG: PD-(D/E)XK nuclease family protein, partial [Pirellulales bacterium]|nr:PD-(D/E)XK nuclease family protein [Pirellulales bacterium]
IEFMWTEAGPGESPRAAGATHRARKREADWIARRIRQMLEDEEALVVDEHNGQPRPVRQGDVTILFRALSDVQVYEEALSKRGIDYYLVGGHAFYAQQEIFDLVNLFRVLASACDDVALAGVLRSPMFSLKDETLFWLCRGQEDDGLAYGLFAAEPPSELDEEQRDRVHFARDTLTHLRSIKDRVPIAELLREMLRLTAYDAILLGEYLGERKLANVHKILDQARAMDRAGFFTVDDFAEQLSEFVASQPREPLAATQPEASDVVRLMTIHQAKGLEFPVVFVPDLDRRSHAASSGVAFEDELGPVVRLPADEGSQPIGAYDLWRVAHDEAERRESDRLFYVATTRAADYLVLSSSVFNLEEPSGRWLKMLADRFDLENGSLKSELPPGYNLPKVRVTREAPATTTPAEKTSKRAPVAEALQALARSDASEDASIAMRTRPIAPDAGARIEYSFSRLSGAFSRDEQTTSDSLETPAWVPDSAAQLGTLVHNVLANVDFGSAADVANIVEREAARSAIDAGDIVQEAHELCQRLLSAPLATQISRAKQLKREVEFLLRWPPNSSGECDRIVRGYIDCIYQDAEDMWHVVDYKTNRTAAKDVSLTAEHYRMQMGVYALAVEQSLGKPPASLTLYFLRPQIAFEIDWDDAARRNTIEIVNDAIERDIQGSG